MGFAQSLSFDDLLFLYEGISWVIAEESTANKAQRMRRIIDPLLQEFDSILTVQLPSAADTRTQQACAEYVCFIMGAAT